MCRPNFYRNKKHSLIILPPGTSPKQRFIVDLRDFVKSFITMDIGVDFPGENEDNVPVSEIDEHYETTLTPFVNAHCVSSFYSNFLNI